MSNYTKIHIIGGPGSGKTFFTNIISKELHLDCCDLDEFFWDSSKGTFGIQMDPNVRDKKLLEVVENDSWTIEGVYYEWVMKSFDRADLIIILLPGVFLRDWRIVKRFVYRKIGLLECDKKESWKNLWDLLIWNHGYDKKNMKDILEITEKYARKRVVLRNRTAVNDFMKDLLENSRD